jgi:lactoylglutathione lyase
MKPELKTAWGYKGNNMNLPVENLDTAIPFYESVMGFRVLSKSESPHRSAILGRDNIQIGLAENGEDPTQDGCAFEVNNADLVFNELKQNGLEKDDPKFEIERHNNASWKVFYVVAPDGLCFWFGERQSERAEAEGA